LSVSVLIEATEVEGFGGAGVVASAFGDVLVVGVGKRERPIQTSLAVSIPVGSSRIPRYFLSQGCEGGSPANCSANCLVESSIEL
jgi:hypothetical protein